MRKRIGLILGVAVLVATLGSLVPSGAATPKGTITGAAAIEVTCVLPSWPTGGSTTTCNGLAVAAVAGRDNKTTGVGGKGEPYAGGGVATVSTVGTIFYNETCIANEPLLGFAQGTLQVGPGPAALFVHKGAPDAGAFVRVPFHWQRVGATAVVTTGKLTGKGTNKEVHFSDGNIAQDTVGDVAVGVLIPTSKPGDCANPTPLTVIVPAVDVEIA